MLVAHRLWGVYSLPRDEARRNSSHIAPPQQQAEAAGNGGTEGESHVSGRVALAQPVEGGAKTAESRADREAESVTQTAAAARCVFGDQAVVKRLMHEVHHGEQPGRHGTQSAVGKAHGQQKWHTGKTDPCQLQFKNSRSREPARQVLPQATGEQHDAGQQAARAPPGTSATTQMSIDRGNGAENSARRHR